MQKILIMRPLSSADSATLAFLATGWDIVIAQGEEAAPHLRNAEILVGAGPKAVEEALRGDALRWVQTWGAGIEGYPLAALAQRGIWLTNASGVHAKPISESILALMLAFSRGLHRLIPDSRAGVWAQSPPLWEIHGQTVGILGVGAIGAETARLCKAFGMRVLGMRRMSTPLEHVDESFSADQLDEALPLCDVVVNILPLTAQTRLLMNGERFAAMKPGSVYISVGRGGTTDQDALLAALQNGAVAYAGLDVTDPEPLPQDHPLWKMDNVIITGHTSGGTVHYDARAQAIFRVNLRAYLSKGKPSRNVVNLEAGY